MVRASDNYIFTAAGTGFAGYDGDTAVASSSSLNGPIYIALRGPKLVISEFCECLWWLLEVMCAAHERRLKQRDQLQARLAWQLSSSTC